MGESAGIHGPTVVARCTPIMPAPDAERLARELLPDGNLPPPWQRYPEMAVGEIGWRMGHGEEFLDLWWHWSRRRTRLQLIEYFHRHAPLPVESFFRANRRFSWAGSNHESPQNLSDGSKRATSISCGPVPFQ